ncbi:bifunctional diguanylate cyclase/phosphodiesterase [Agrobacterium sp. Azo12]|uniref:bifunctional diguanylate cyclase/phosphodiesterase n=1 Tax=Agrobacterium sp. Azo12 TaxID=3031129 RepID=UPI0023D898F4|nr:EAL domain-containing protein [Agrobacterium sp. Azo12]MDO5894802.1 EAL domain-containing protein [Agrobacterium sp. Azo12]
MNSILTCLVYEHDMRLVVLAGILCLLSATVAMLLLRRAVKSSGLPRVIWIAATGGASGFGIWTTHFVAMLAYDPGFVFGYEINGTLISLAVAIGTTVAAAACATYDTGRHGTVAAGVLFGIGVTSMHFIGMTVIELPGTIVWDRSLVIAASILAVALSVPAFAVRRAERTSGSPVILPAALLTLAIVGMHFTAMGAITVVPDYSAPASNVISAGVMVLIITCVTLSFLFAGLTAAMFAMRAEMATVAGETNFRRLVQGVTDYAIYMLDTEGRVSNWNVGAERAKGYTADEIVGQHFSQFYSQEDRAAGLPEKALETARTKGKFESEGLRYRKDGSSFWAAVVIDAIYAEDGTLAGYAKITRDCTEQKRAANRIQEASDNLALALDNMANGIMLFDKDERLVLQNTRLNEIVGIPDNADLVGKTFREICELPYGHDAGSKIDASDFYHGHIDLIRATEGGETIRTIQNERTVRVIHRPAVQGAWVTTVEDITERVKSEKRIAHLARHDVLTGLPNRRQFVETLDAAIRDADTLTSKVAVIAVDLDNFKEVNDTLGHAAGDSVLVTLAKRLGERLLTGETVGRLGGDEFVAIKSFNDQTELDEFIRRMNRLLTTKIELSHTEIVPGASLGVAIYPQDATDREKLLSNADMAMYRSKASIEQKISFYEAAMDEAARERRAMGRDIWIALEKKQFYLTYQVQRSVKTDEVTGYEVLLRWLHPERGLVSPVDFIPIAEECGAISAIGEWVLQQACREAADWDIPHKIAVNLSPLQLNNVILVEKVREILLDTGLPAARLELEVTESAIIGDKARALHILRQIKAMGVTIAIDDFGTGYSSLETLRSFPFDKIKLDKSFVHELESRQSKAFVRAIVALGKSLDVAVLAEGVETREQLQVLLSEGCDEVQGFLFGRPATREQLSASTPLLFGIGKAV